MSAWLVCDVILLSLSILMCFWPPVRLFGIGLVVVVFVLGLIVIFHNYNERKSDSVEFQAIRADLARIYAKFQVHIDENVSFSNAARNKANLSKYGGALYFQVVVNGTIAGGDYLLDCGDAKHLQYNRVSLYVNEDKTISMVLFDAEGKEYRVTSSESITTGQSHVIACMWNKKFGDLVLFIDGVIKGSVSVVPLNVEQVLGELAVGSNLEGVQQGSIIAQKVAVFSFNS